MTSFPTGHEDRDSSSIDGISDEGGSLAERLAYLALTDDDRRRLRSAAATFASSSDPFVDQFYEHLLRFDATSQWLKDPALVSRLKEKQRDHFETMLEAKWDDAYVARRLRVGEAHADVGLNPQWFLGAYVQYLQYSFRLLSADHDGPTRDGAEQMLSLTKAVFLDIGLTLDAYFDRSTENLRKALDLFWKANDELRRFAQLTSHDLKTPIATVANLCEEALDEFGDQMPAEAAELIASARQRILRMSTMIDELLQSSMARSSGEEDRVAHMDEILHEVLDRLEPALRDKEIEVVLPEGLPTVQGNPAHLREAFYNLLSNAVKFMERRPGRITIDVEPSETQYLFSIADTGPGIPGSDLQRIFVPFRRLASHRDKPGSGLGLYFTMNLIEGEGGHIWAESRPGEGSCFYVALRRQPEPDGD